MFCVVNNPIICPKIKRSKSIIKKLKKDQKIYTQKIFLICVQKHSKSLFEILELSQFENIFLKKSDYIIVGLADNKDNAENMICKLIIENLWLLNCQDIHKIIDIFN